MQTAFILHGICDADEYFAMDFPSPSNAHWIPALQQKFLRDGMLCQALEMPTPYQPDYTLWDRIFSAPASFLTSDSIIVAHSAGCGFILKWLSARANVRLAKLVMVAPFLDPARRYGDFMDFTIDPALQDRIAELHVFFSRDEPVKGVAGSAETIRQSFPSHRFRAYGDQGHFCFSDPSLPVFADLWHAAKP